MYRSQEILQILSTKNLPIEVCKYILYLERKNTFEDSIFQMIYNAYLFHSEKSKRFFYEENKNLFLSAVSIHFYYLNKFYKFNLNLNEID